MMNRSEWSQVAGGESNSRQKRFIFNPLQKQSGGESNSRQKRFIFNPLHKLKILIKKAEKSFKKGWDEAANDRNCEIVEEQRIQPSCRTIYNDECSTVEEEKCSTEYEEECHLEDMEKCSTEYVEECTTVVE